MCTYIHVHVVYTCTTQHCSSCSFCTLLFTDTHTSFYFHWQQQCLSCKWVAHCCRPPRFHHPSKQKHTTPVSLLSRAITWWRSAGNRTQAIHGREVATTLACSASVHVAVTTPQGCDIVPEQQTKKLVSGPCSTMRGQLHQWTMLHCQHPSLSPYGTLWRLG